MKKSERKTKKSGFENWILSFILIMLVLISFSINDASVIVSPLESNGAIPVNIQDQHTEIIDLLLNKKLDNLTLLSNYSVDDKYINISTTGSVPVIGNRVCLKEHPAFYQGSILSVNSLGGNDYELEMDSPLDYPFTIEGGCSLSTVNLAVDGSITPQMFSISPRNLDNDTSWDVVRMIIYLEDNSAMDISKFGGIPALTNGVVFRVKNGLIKNIFNAKTNGDFGLRAFDYSYVEKAPAGTYGAFIRRTFGGQSKNGVTIRLNADTKDAMQVIIQDDLTDLLYFKIVIQGHVVNN